MTKRKRIGITDQSLIKEFEVKEVKNEKGEIIACLGTSKNKLIFTRLKVDMDNFGEAVYYTKEINKIINRKGSKKAKKVDGRSAEGIKQKEIASILLNILSTAGIHDEISLEGIGKYFVQLTKIKICF